MTPCSRPRTEGFGPRLPSSDQSSARPSEIFATPSYLAVPGATGSDECEFFSFSTQTPTGDQKEAEQYSLVRNDDAVAVETQTKTGGQKSVNIRPRTGDQKSEEGAVQLGVASGSTEFDHLVSDRVSVSQVEL